MRIYSAESEETLRARGLVKEWSDDDFLTKEQAQRLEIETVSDLRTTNVFLRLVLFLFTLIGVGAAAGLFFTVFIPRSSEKTIGIFCLLFAALCYAAAELSVSRFRLYRFGIEEALATCSVIFLCVGIESVFFSGRYFLYRNAAWSVVPAAGAVFSLWIWHRFGLWYAFLAAMIFAIFVPGYWTSSLPAQHAIIVSFYATGLIPVAAVRSHHRLDYLRTTYSLAEAFLWLGIYLALNLKLSSLDTLSQRWSLASMPFGTPDASQFARPFYWTTWVLIWCLPPVILARGIRRKDRFVIAVGAMVTILTFVTNKPYLGWTRHTWDPMLLGILLTGVALFVRRWLARATFGVRHGFTATRLSGKDKHWMNAASSMLGAISPQSVTPSPQPNSSEFHFGGGSTGGGGAGGDF